MVKAASFASIGVVNATVNYVVFWLALRLLEGASAPPAAWIGRQACAAA